jgi:hypothetical protein
VQKQSKALTALGVALMFLLALAACAPQPSLAPGTYASTIAREDTTSFLFIGDWELTLADNNEYSLSKDGEFWEEGNYNVTGDQIAITMSEGTYPCGATGTYTWTSGAEDLTLTTVGDTCEGRPKILTMHTWSQ